MRRHRKRFSFEPVGEDIAVGALEQAADRSTQFEHPRRHFPCSRFSSNIVDRSPIVATTKVWYCGDHSGTAQPLICGLQVPQATT